MSVWPMNVDNEVGENKSVMLNVFIVLSVEHVMIFVLSFEKATWVMSSVWSVIVAKVPIYPSLYCSFLRLYYSFKGF